MLGSVTRTPCVADASPMGRTSPHEAPSGHATEESSELYRGSGNYGGGGGGRTKPILWASMAPPI